MDSTITSILFMALWLGLVAILILDKLFAREE